MNRLLNNLQSDLQNIKQVTTYRTDYNYLLLHLTLLDRYDNSIIMKVIPGKYIHTGYYSLVQVDFKGYAKTTIIMHNKRELLQFIQAYSNNYLTIKNR